MSDQTTTGKNNATVKYSNMYLLMLQNLVNITNVNFTSETFCNVQEYIILLCIIQLNLQCNFKHVNHG